MPRASLEVQQDQLIDQLAECSNSRARARFLRGHKQLWEPAVVERLYARVVRLARIDLQRADRLAQASKWVAEKLEDDGCRAQSLRAAGHIRFIAGKYAEALQHYDAAMKLFRRLGREVDVGRTLNGALQSFISLGKYEEALEAARQARLIFERHGVSLGLARLDSNVGNILIRQDRFDEALALYTQAYAQLSVIGEPQDVAAVLSNMALCYINLNDFEKALKTYHDARTYCEDHDMPLLVAQADYNIAYLYYLRGEYTRALDLYRTAQEHSDDVKDAYHSALCDLDRSEMYLELNLCDEAGELAERALAHFGRLRMAYEEAKAVTNLALATSRKGDIRRARQLFRHARQLFGRERNEVRLALVDFYEALVLYRDGQHVRARALAENARALFSGASAPTSASLCDLLLARLELQAGNLQAAEAACHAVSKRIAGTETPILTYQAHFVLGLVREAQGKRDAAFEAFEKAHAALEHLRSHLRGDDLKVAFFEDKQAVYESLVSTCLTLGPVVGQLEAVFGYIEKAKSRSLADLIAFRAGSLAPRVAGAATEAVRRLRQELNSHYRQLELEELTREKRSARRIEGLQHRARALEKQLSRSLEEVRHTDEEFSALQSGASFGLEEIRSTLAPDTILLEYYQARGRTYVCVLGRDQLEIVALGPITHVRDLLRLLQFQFSKFRLGPNYIGAFTTQLQAATEMHLRDLYAALIAPIRDRLRATHLVVVPHDVLHFLPFHALYDGQRYLIDEFTLSYAPSSSVYRLCRTKHARSTGGALIMGVPDRFTPFIVDEVRAVASVLPDPHVFLGLEATADQLQRHGEESRFVHIATHGLFRRDNPMFSSIRLGDGLLSVYDLYQLRLSAELVTLSGCGTGLSVVVGGDEQLGLVRGLLYAGAGAVLLTLWDAYDSSTADFMTAFYGHLPKGWSKAGAAQQAMWQLRERYPHPFYWAPFALTGNVEAAKAGPKTQQN
jgi:CHAT domain-containing protein